MLTTLPSLLRRLHERRDEQAWQRFVDLYTPVLLTWARRLDLSATDASDLVQEVLALLIVKLPLFERKREGSFRAWLKTVTRNKWLELQRRRHPQPVGDGQDLPLPPMSDHAEKFWEQDYREHLIARAIEIMKADFQSATWQAAWQVLVAERPAAEVAAELSLTVGAVHAARFRVLARLKQELADMLDD